MSILDMLSTFVYGPIVVPSEVLAVRASLEETMRRLSDSAAAAARAPAPVPPAPRRDADPPLTPAFEQLERERLLIERIAALVRARAHLRPWGLGDVDVDPYV